MWRQEYQHHEQLPLAFNGTWPSWNSDLDNRECPYLMLMLFAVRVCVHFDDVLVSGPW
jgi:hypothetical protein